MQLLIIDNGTERLAGLQTLLGAKGANQVTTVTAQQFGDELAGTDLDGYDAVVIAGDLDAKVWNEPYFLHEIELINTTTKPVLGIGDGFELLCYAVGCQLHEDFERAVGADRLTPTDAGAKLFQGTDPIRVDDVSRWAIDELPKVLQVLARSDLGIEAVKHKTRPLYGFQLFAENFAYPSDGAMVYSNVLDSLKTS